MGIGISCEQPYCIFFMHCTHTHNTHTHTHTYMHTQCGAKWGGGGGVHVHMYPHVHIPCVQDVSKQLEGLAKHLRASGKKPDSPHTQLALIGSSQAVLLVRKPVLVGYTFAVGHYLLTKHQNLQWKVATVGSSSICKANLHSYTLCFIHC